MSEPVVEMLWIFQCCRVMYVSVDKDFFVYFLVLSGHVWTYWWILLISLNIGKSCLNMLLKLFEYSNGQVMYEPIDGILWFFLVLSNRVWTYWLNFHWYSGCHQVNVWTCLFEHSLYVPWCCQVTFELVNWALFEYSSVVRSCLNLLLKIIWIFWCSQVMYEPVTKISLHIPQLSFLQ